MCNAYYGAIQGQLTGREQLCRVRVHTLVRNIPHDVLHFIFYVSIKKGVMS